MRKFIILLLSVFLIISCETDVIKNKKEIWKNEILETEKAFAALALKEGIEKAFLTYASDDAVLMRNNSVIEGIDSIRNYFEKANINPEKTSLSWEPDFVDVSETGDLGYTYGKYVYRSKNEEGKVVENKGIFHTVWKRQTDGKWKFVWD